MFFLTVQRFETVLKRFINAFKLSLVKLSLEDSPDGHSDRFAILCICWDTPSENTGL